MCIDLQSSLAEEKHIRQKRPLHGHQLLPRERGPESPAAGRQGLAHQAPPGRGPGCSGRRLWGAGERGGWPWTRNGGHVGGFVCPVTVFEEVPWYNNSYPCTNVGLRELESTLNRSQAPSPTRVYGTGIPANPKNLEQQSMGQCAGRSKRQKLSPLENDPVSDVI